MPRCTSELSKDCLTCCATAAEGSYGKRLSWPWRNVNFDCRNSRNAQYRPFEARPREPRPRRLRGRIGRVDGAKPGSKRQSCERLGALFFQAVPYINDGIDAARGDSCEGLGMCQSERAPPGRATAAQVTAN